MKPINKEKFFLMVNNLFDELSPIKALKERMQLELSTRNIPPTTVLAIMNRNIPVETLDHDLLCLIIKLLYKITGETEFEEVLSIENRNNLNPINYYHTNELINADFYKVERKEKYPLVIPNVYKMADDLYTTILDIKTIQEWHYNGIIYYNERTQRGKVSRIYNNNIVKTIDVNSKSIAEMVECIKENRQVPDDLWFNILKNGEDEFEYNEETKELTIYAGEIDSIDGWHREMAILDALRENSNIQLNWGVKIANFTEEKARYFISQQDKRNPLRKSVAESLNKQRLSNLVVDELNKGHFSKLKNRITVDDIAARYDKSLIQYRTLSDTIEYNFKLETKKDVFNITQWLVAGFDMLIESYPNEFENNIYFNHPNMFICYVAMFSELYDKQNWEALMYKTIDKIILNPEKLWFDLNIGNNISRNREQNIKRISRDFKEFINQEVVKSVSL